MVAGLTLAYGPELEMELVGIIAFALATGSPSSVCVVGCAFIMAVSVYQISKTKAEI